MCVCVWGGATKILWGMKKHWRTTGSPFQQFLNHLSVYKSLTNMLMQSGTISSSVLTNSTHFFLSSFANLKRIKNTEMVNYNYLSIFTILFLASAILHLISTLHLLADVIMPMACLIILGVWYSNCTHIFMFPENLTNMLWLLGSIEVMKLHNSNLSITVVLTVVNRYATLELQCHDDSILRALYAG